MGPTKRISTNPTTTTLNQDNLIMTTDTVTTTEITIATTTEITIATIITATSLTKVKVQATIPAEATTAAITQTGAGIQTGVPPLGTMIGCQAAMISSPVTSEVRTTRTSTMMIDIVARTITTQTTIEGICQMGDLL